MKFTGFGLLVATYCFSLSLAAAAKTESFELKPFPTEKSETQDIKNGLLRLYKNEISEAELAKQISRAEDFQNTLYGLLNQKISENKMIQAEVTTRALTGNFVRETVIHFPSLVQRTDLHASNQVVAKIYEPAVVPAFCDYKFPATIFLHHILNELPKIEDAAKVMASGVTHQAAIIVVLHMPHYGERKQGDEQFLNSNLAAFRQNMMQLTLDIHMLRNFLETRTNIDQSKLSLTGISLGAVMGIASGAFDQGFTGGYGSLVGGVDMANILFNRATNRKDSEVAIALKDIELNESSVRNELAAVDAAVWMHRYRGKRFFALNASRDDIVLYDNSVKPLLETLKANGNEVIERLNDDTHSPTGSIFKKLKNVFNPMVDFILNGSPDMNQACPRQSN